MNLPYFSLAPDLASKVEGGLVTALIIGAYKLLHSRILNSQITKRLADDPYTPAEIKNRVSSNQGAYVRPDCQDSNPANSAQNRGGKDTRRPIFKEVDSLLGPPLLSRFTLILADTGMGKSTFLERYYAYHWRSPERCKRFKPIVVPLNGLDTNELINQISPQHRSETVLLLDALDEDSAAIENFASRLEDLVRLTSKFRAVIVTCRTQFIPDSCGNLKEIDLPAPSGPLGLSGGPDRKVRLLYLSPFSDEQVKRFLRSRLQYWRIPAFRARAERTVKRFEDLISRPLLLTYIQDLAFSSEVPKYSFQVYRLIVDGWLKREEVKNRLAVSPEDLLLFSEELAIKLFSTGRDRVSTAELREAAERRGVGPVFGELKERSLVHNDSEGNWKFAHRSIMEYFLVDSVAGAPSRPGWAARPWTDQMRKFAGEILMSGECNRMPGADLRMLHLEGTNFYGFVLREANLSGANLSNSCLEFADLSKANLKDARLVKARMFAAEVGDACLNGTDLSAADLTGVSGLTGTQRKSAIADSGTKWPNRPTQRATKDPALNAHLRDSEILVPGTHEANFFDSIEGFHKLASMHNAELLAQQCIRRRGVRTPEFYFPRDIDNSELLRPKNPTRIREMRLLSAAVAALFSVTLVYCIQRVLIIDVELRVKTERQLIDQLRKENIQLRMIEAKLTERLAGGPGTEGKK